MHEPKIMKTGQKEQYTIKLLQMIQNYCCSTQINVEAQARLLEQEADDMKNMRVRFQCSYGKDSCIVEFPVSVGDVDICLTSSNKTQQYENVSLVKGRLEETALTQQKFDIFIDM